MRLPAANVQFLLIADNTRVEALLKIHLCYS